MVEPNPFALGFPLGGIDKSTGYDDQPDGTTPSCLNVWPFQWKKGRARGGVRPGLTAIGNPSGTPLNWCLASWDGGYGIAVTTTLGTYVTTDGSIWNARISTAPSSNFASCAVYNNILYQASAGDQFVRTCDLRTNVQGILTVETYTADSPQGGGAKGVVPTYCGLVYADSARLVLAGDYYHPHVAYFSRADNPRDWDYASASVNDPGASFATSGPSGKINKPIVGVMSHGNDCLMFGHVDGFSVVIGNARIGEIIKSDQEIGPLMQSAWCKTASDHTVFMSREGLYAIPGGCTRDIQCELISKQIPNDLVGLDPGAPGVGDTCSVVYDGRYQGIHIYVDRSGSGTDTHYFFSLVHRSFFPMSFAAGNMKLGVSFPKLATATKSGVIAMKSGAAYQFDTDSTENIASHCYYGPIPYGSALTEGRLVRINAVLSEDTQSVPWELYSGQSPQEAFSSSTPKFVGDPWAKSGLNFWQYPRDLGVAGYIKAYGTNQSRWCIEKIIGECYPTALQRRGA